VANLLPAQEVCAPPPDGVYLQAIATEILPWQHFLHAYRRCRTIVPVTAPCVWQLVTILATFGWPCVTWVQETLHDVTRCVGRLLLQGARLARADLPPLCVRRTSPRLTSHWLPAAAERLAGGRVAGPAAAAGRSATLKVAGGRRIWRLPESQAARVPEGAGARDRSCKAVKPGYLTAQFTYLWSV
jgi:hypothetical protein